MRASKQKDREPIWSARSQKSWLKQLGLEATLEKVHAQIAFLEKRITQLRGVATQQTETATSGSYAIQQALSSTLSDIAERERTLGAYKERESALIGEIAALTQPPPKEARQRARQQSALASLAFERWRKDAIIDSVIQKLRTALQARQELTLKMLDTANLLEFPPGTDFDVTRFEALEKALPLEVLAQSHVWLNTFLGQGNDVESYVTGPSGAVLPETLAHCGIYRPGEVAMLTAERAALLPPEETEKPVSTPMEMESLAGNTDPMLRKSQATEPQASDDCELSGFPLR